MHGAAHVRGAGLKGALLFVAVHVAAEVALVPGSPLTMAAGFAYGPLVGLLVASPASVLATTVVAVVIVTRAARQALERELPS